MEKGGWLDQILLGILGFLNQQWLAIAVALVGSCAVTYLARTSPKRDWEYLKEGPGNLLLGAFVLFAVVRSAPRLVIPKTTFGCERRPGAFGIPVSTDCRAVSSGTVHVVYDYTVVDLVRELVDSAVTDLVFGAGGVAAGFVVGTLVRRRRRTTTGTAG